MRRFVWLGAAMVAFLGATAANAVRFDLVTLRSDGTPPSSNGDGSNQPAITPDGRYVVFTASATGLVTPDATGFQIYLRDRVAGTTELISVNSTGGAGNTSSSGPSISDDGCRVVFMSFASNLVAGDANGTQDAFVRDRCAQPRTTSLVSVSSGGVPATAQSYDARISGDGSKVAFINYEGNLVTPSLLGSTCLYMRNLNARTTTAIMAPNGRCTPAEHPDLSRDGSRVVFWSLYDPGTSNYISNVWQVLLYDFNTAAFSVVSASSSGVPQSQGSEGASTITAPAISSDGGYVAFRSRGAGLVAVAGGGFSHVYIKELATGTIVRASVDSAGNPGNADSSGGGQGYRPGLAKNGKTVTFLTSATNIAPETGGSYPNVVAHNPFTGRTVGFTSWQLLTGLPAITDGGELIVAYSNYQLDPAYASRGMFVFAGMVARLGNIATRAQVLTGEDVMIGGFIIGGSAPKTVVVRARGPSLIPLGVANALANPRLDLFSGQTIIASNDDWQSASNAATLTSSGFAPANNLESAVLVTLNPGPYTAIVSGSGGGTGVGIVEVFEVDRPEVPLINIATRGKVLTGNDVMIGGFIISGTDPQTVVVRARGPSLVPLGIANALANPVLQLFSGQTMIASNDDWQSATNAATLQASGFAPANALESAILITLNPGPYTAIMTGAGGGTGVGIVEVFAR